ncbi:uncharacterized protein [Physcomitrium patens]|uniref:Alpha-type protein kinase domain-containing protein n=1 Tax=Physcomitrium patens TaxID=3218 RepID=A0A2K1J108_PHYPA|nr:alpha-protein kinase vwkA-like [Physcomitrium patens]XP_024402665.1 alpha-protein kinase vwkA-like [Physcomitrium patens]XP_024402666.1 alpha-protein kinase vwkA-like [Physcomitrium patens]PNR35203.1 hypothetical protein PHYPA_023102 [Physcomitrium patens]|eukprot:XP_024402664.1 alpha-protein kinase vwkA-like [Physcomitrella patens]
MDPIKEGSHERSFGSSHSGQSTAELNEQLAQLRRELELLKASKTRTHVTSYPDESVRSQQVREQAELPRQERLLTSRYSRRSFQDARTLSPTSQANLHASRNEYQHQAPVPHEDISSQIGYAGEESSAHKYVIEAPFGVKTISRSITSRSQSLPKPSAPPGASTRSLAHSLSTQVDRDANTIRQDRNLLRDSPLKTEHRDSGAPSPEALQGPGMFHMLGQEKEKLMASRVTPSFSDEVPSGTADRMHPAARRPSIVRQANSNPLSSESRMSLSTLKAMKGKNELEMPKASEAEIPAISNRTRQVLEELEKLKRENAMLKSSKAKEMDSAQQRLAYFEQNHAAASKVRMVEIKKMIIKSQELDLAFLVDATGSMQSSIDMIKTTVTTMASGIMQSYPDCKLRVAFVPYRDYEDTAQDDREMLDFTTSFSGLESVFVQALSRVRAVGGGDDAEDVFTGIARVAQLSWVAPNRVLFHIADAPCHGLSFHDGVGDLYPNGDKYGRTINAQFRILHEVCHISTYFFCHLNSSTKKMIRKFREAAGSSLDILEEQFVNISNIPHKVITLCRGTIQKTLSVVNAQNPIVDVQFVREDVIKGVPSWAQVPEQSGVHFRCKWYRALDDMLSRISNHMALEEESMDHIQVQIAKHPFSDEGAVRWPYHALITYPNESPRSMVVKRFKTPLGKDVREIHKRERYWAQMEVQSVSAHMANEFNKITSNMKNVKKVEFTEVTTLEVGSGSNIKFYNMESLLEGEWMRYSNNGGYVNTLDYAAVLQAFTHWTHERSRGLLMVTDLQGVRMTNLFGENVFCLCDPAIHCTDVMRFTRTNLGAEGFKLFFETHKCNDVCEKLRLAVGTAGRTLSGTKVGSYW